MATILSEIVRHHLWANLAIADFCATLSDSQLQADATGTYGGIGLTLLHLADGEARYAEALGGAPRDPVVDDSQPFPGHEPIRESLQRSGLCFSAIADSEHVDRVIVGQRGGRAFSVPLSVFMIQAIDHGKEHRTQISAALTGLGIESPSLDGWADAARAR